VVSILTIWSLCNNIHSVSLLYLLIVRIWYLMIYLLTAIGLSPSGSTHLHTNNTQNNTNNNWTTQIQTNAEEYGQCPVFASFTLAFALQLRKKHGKTSVRVRKISVRLRKISVKVQYTYTKNTHTLQKLLFNFNTREIQMKTLKVRYKFETQLNCLVSWQQWYSWVEEWLTGGSTMQECNTTAQ
jgi:hypothetical protein